MSEVSVFSVGHKFYVVNHPRSSSLAHIIAFGVLRFFSDGAAKSRTIDSLTARHSNAADLKFDIRLALHDGKERCGYSGRNGASTLSSTEYDDSTALATRLRQQRLVRERLVLRQESDLLSSCVYLSLGKNSDYNLLRSFVNANCQRVKFPPCWLAKQNAKDWVLSATSIRDAIVIPYLHTRTHVFPSGSTFPGPQCVTITNIVRDSDLEPGILIDEVRRPELEYSSCPKFVDFKCMFNFKTHVWNVMLAFASVADAKAWKDQARVSLYPSQWRYFRGFVLHTTKGVICNIVNVFEDLFLDAVLKGLPRRREPGYQPPRVVVKEIELFGDACQTWTEIGVRIVDRDGSVFGDAHVSRVHPLIVYYGAEVRLGDWLPYFLMQREVLKDHIFTVSGQKVKLELRFVLGDHLVGDFITGNVQSSSPQSDLFGKTWKDSFNEVFVHDRDMIARLTRRFPSMRAQSHPGAVFWFPLFLAFMCYFSGYLFESLSVCLSLSLSLSGIC